jgi:hypothetical protein
MLQSVAHGAASSRFMGVMQPATSCKETYTSAQRHPKVIVGSCSNLICMLVWYIQKNFSSTRAGVAYCNKDAVLQLRLFVLRV